MADTLEFHSDPADLVTVRTLSHAAIQWPSRAARANLSALSDDSHSSLGWSEEHAALVSQVLDASSGIQLGFSFRRGALIWIEDGRVTDALGLAGHGEATAEGWCDEHLAAAGLSTTDLADMPYTLDPVSYAAFEAAEKPLETLGAWFSCAQAALEALVATHGAQAVSVPGIRCWPHHYDIATLFALDEGDPETARSVGVGLSPGDSFYAEPYLYCNPWPVPDGALPMPPEPLRWHTEGFTSLVCPAGRMGDASKLEGLAESAFTLVRELLQK